MFISLPVAERIFQLQLNPLGVYVRADQHDVTQVSKVLAPTVDTPDVFGV